MYWRTQARKRSAHRGATDQGNPERIYCESTALEAEESTREQMQLSAQLREAVSSLPDRYRTVIMLRFFEGLTCDMVAEVLDRRIGTVKSLIHRGVKRLREILELDATFCQVRHLKERPWARCHHERS